jgi:hypothetical protein
VPIPAGPAAPSTYRPGIGTTLSGWSVELDGWSAGAMDANLTEWWITAVEGWRDRPAMRVSSQARQADHGSFDAPSYLDSRIITIEGTAVCPDEDTAYLSADIMASVCQDPAVLYPLVVIEPGRPVRRANVRLNAGTKVGEPYGAGAVAFDWSLLLRAPDPRRYADTETAVTLTLPSGADAGLQIPFTVPFYIPDSGVSTNRATVINEGTFATRPVVTFVGPVGSPAIVNLTQGKTLAFDISITSGQTLVVDFASRSVLLDGTVSRAYTIAYGSAWWDLAPGSNDVQYAGVGSGTALLTYRSSWL